MGGERPQVDVPDSGMSHGPGRTERGGGSFTAPLRMAHDVGLTNALLLEFVT